MHNQTIKYAPFGRRTLVPRAVYGRSLPMPKGHAKAFTGSYPHLSNL